MQYLLPLFFPHTVRNREQTYFLGWPNFHPLKVVDRDSETQLKVGENLNKITRPNKGFSNNYGSD